VALGANSVATDPNTVSVGSPGNLRRITNAAPAIYGTDVPNWAQVQNLVKGLKQGLAAAMAMGSSVTPSAPGKTTLSLNGATYDGYYAASVSFVHRLKTETPIYISGAVSGSEGGTYGGRVGVAVEF